MSGDMMPGHVSRGLRRPKIRTLAIVVGCILIIAAIIVMAGVCLIWGRGGAGTKENTGAYFAVFSPVSATSCACGSPTGNPTEEAQAGGFMALGGIQSNLIPDSFAVTIRGLSSVKDAVTFLCYQFKDPRDGRLFTVGGLDLGRPQAAGTAPCRDSDVTTGRFLSAGDSGTVLLEEDYARSLGLKVGDTIIVSDRTFIIAGIVDAAILPAQAEVYMPRAEAERLISAKLPDLPVSGQSNMILVEAKSSSTRGQAIREVNNLFPDLIVSSY